MAWEDKPEGEGKRSEHEEERGGEGRGGEGRGGEGMYPTLSSSSRAVLSLQANRSIKQCS